jgi:hypothetical protein
MEVKHDALSRNHRFMFAQVFSIGLKSGEYGGKNNSRTFASFAGLSGSFFLMEAGIIQYHR